MAVIDEEKEGKLILEITKGDKEKFQETLKKWNFKNPQSLLRFSLSILLKTQGEIGIFDLSTGLKKVVPANHLLEEHDPTNEKN